MNAIYLLLFVLFGLLFGSFFNVIGLRVPKKESIIYPNSHCTNCKHELSWWELIPVLSYLFLHGKCRKCRTKISPIYPMMEAITGGLFALSYYYLGWEMELLAALFFVSLLVIITVSDLEYMIIPDKILIVFLLLFIAIRIFEPLNPWWDSIVGAVLGFAILYLLAIVSRGGMGGGDIKLFFVLGIILGTKAIIMTLFFASLLGSLVGIIQMLFHKWKKKTPIPFGPFISIGALLSYFYRDTILEWYIQFLS
ncbi:prepilin peptidase [Caldibacillus lycopersici]|uniref:Prepilin peptidase n=1 Tax=Perspicuibacillus lycopersici TaxID=1325689 RepID=A0AAE3ITD2_9BACI|nr:A24 family peptidase [Perspicuibacillus lycopersici]MCU9614017.1 prepilin peptidase [Perspicuibacillus lycopersici]